MAKRKIEIIENDFLIENEIEIDFNDFNDFNMNFDLDDFDLDGIIISNAFESRYIKPKKNNDINENFIKTKNAADLATKIKVAPNERLYCILNGSFIFGDLIEQLIFRKNLLVNELTIATLSLSKTNIDGLAELMKLEYIEKFNLIVSDYFYSHERYKLVPYIYEMLDHDNKFQLAVGMTHTKICLMKTDNDDYVVIHGSANLRSSNNIEQIMIENNKELYDFNYDFFQIVIETFKTIDKSKVKTNGGEYLWQAVAEVNPAVEVKTQKKVVSVVAGQQATANRLSEK
jgi:hypothetical protein